MPVCRRGLITALAALPVVAGGKVSGDFDAKLASALADNPVLSPEVLFTRHRLQYLVTRLARGHAQELAMQADRRQWATPASLVKLPVALCALERLAQLAGSLAVDLDTALLRRQAPACVAAEGPEPETLRRTLTRAFVVSDNAAYNRLLDFVGFARLHERLFAMGYRDARIVSRFADCSRAENTRGAAFDYQDGKRWRRLIDLPAPWQAPAHPLGALRFGSGFATGGRIEAGPVDVSWRNHLPLADVHQMLVALAEPDAVPVAQRWRIPEDWRQWLLATMRLRPPDSRDPRYDPLRFPDGHTKFLFPTRVPGLAVANKVGEAYGFVADCAYLEQQPSALRAVLSAQLYCNANDILNDGRYEVETLGKPFLAWFGQTVLALLASG